MQIEGRRRYVMTKESVDSTLIHRRPPFLHASYVCEWGSHCQLQLGHSKTCRTLKNYLKLTLFTLGLQATLEELRGRVRKVFLVVATQKYSWIHCGKL